MLQSFVETALDLGEVGQLIEGVYIVGLSAQDLLTRIPSVLEAAGGEIFPALPRQGGYCLVRTRGIRGRRESPDMPQMERS